MKLWTPQSLLRRFRGEADLSQRRLDDAVARARKAGWALAYHPMADAPARLISGVQPGDPLHGLYEMTYRASRMDRRGHAAMSRWTLEALAGRSVVWPECGQRLGERGLLLFHVQGRRVYAVGASPDLAIMANALRYETTEHGVESAALVQAVLGLGRKPSGRIPREQLYDAAEMLHWLGIDADCLFERTRRCRPRSRWHVADTVRDPITDLPLLDGELMTEVA